MSKGIIPTAAEEKQPTFKPDAAKLQSKAEKIREIQDKLSAPSRGLWSALTDVERRFLQHHWQIEAAELASYSLDEYEWVLENLRPVPAWDEDSPQGFLVSLKTISIAITTDGVIDIRTIDKGTRLRVAIDCTTEEAKKWLAAGLVKALPCVTERALISGQFGISLPALKRGKLFATEGDGNERGLLQRLELGFSEFICDGAYRDDPATLRPCPIPYRRRRSMRTKLIPKGEGGVRPYAEQFEDTSEFASVPRILRPPAFDWLSSPMIRCRSHFTGELAGLPLQDGHEFEARVFWALKMAADPCKLNSHGKPAVEILDPLPSEAWETYKPVLTAFMEAHPGCLTDAPGFPIPVGV